MTDVPECQEVSVMYATALAASLISVMPADMRGSAAVAIDEHIRDIMSREGSQTGVSQAHAEVRALLQTFREQLSG